MDDKLTPADPDDLARSISFALRFNRRKRFHQGEEFMTNLTAGHIVQYLDKCGYVVMKRPPIGSSAPQSPPASYPRTEPGDLR